MRAGNGVGGVSDRIKSGVRMTRIGVDPVSGPRSSGGGADVAAWAGEDGPAGAARDVCDAGDASDGTDDCADVLSSPAVCLTEGAAASVGDGCGSAANGCAGDEIS